MDDILDIKMQKNDANAETIRDYLHSLLQGVWRGKDSFKGKRPFGNSGWEHELLIALVLGGALQGDVTAYPEGDFDVEGYDAEEGFKIIRSAIHYMCYSGKYLNRGSSYPDWG